MTGDSDLERTLTDELHAAPLSDQSLARMHAVVAQEWRTVLAEERGATAAREPVIRWGRPRWMALAAAAALAVVAVGFMIAGPSRTASIGSLSRLDGTLEVRSGIFRHRRLHQGESLRSGDRFTTRGPALVGLARGGTLRIAAGTTLLINAPTEVSLERGLIYLDLPPVPNVEKPFRVATSAGAILHVGTEFEVMSQPLAVRVRVREGRIRFLGLPEGLPGGPPEAIVADAGTELLVAPGHPISRRAIDTYGADWLWTAALTPKYEIEGTPLIDFLRWASRESGRPLDFADDGARRIADRTILHGSVGNLAPLDAVSRALATTSLICEIRGGTLVILSTH